MPYKEPPKEHQFKPGQSGNPGGRVKNTMKDHIAIKFKDMSPEEKDEWLEEKKVSGEVQFKMAEGNPDSNTKHGGDSDNPIVFMPIEMMDKYKIESEKKE